jgi:hypothetical protein
VLFLIFLKKWSTVRVGLEKHPIFKENLSQKRKKNIMQRKIKV